MSSSVKHVTLFLAALLMVFTSTPVFGVPNIKLEERIEFSPGTDLPSFLWSFCVTEDNFVIIPDEEGGKIRFYEKAGNLLKLAKTPEGKELVIDGLSSPTFCFYNRNEGKFGVLDFGKKEAVIYNRIGSREYERAYTAPCPGRGYDVQLSGDGSKLLISGYIIDEDKKSNELYSYNLEDLPRESQPYELSTVPPTFLLLSEDKYNSKDWNNADTFTIGTKGWFDVQGESILYSWEGDLRIIKINIKTGEKFSFGEQRMSRYSRPYVTEQMKDARRERNFKTLQLEKTKMSFVRNVFTTSKLVLVVMEGPNSATGGSNFWMQFYTLEGKFLNEKPFPGKASWMMYFDKKETLYSLSEREGNTQKPFIIKYMISE